MKSAFLDDRNTLFAIHCFATLKVIDRGQKADWFLYNHIVSYTLYDPQIHTVDYACSKGNLVVLKYLIDQGIGDVKTTLRLASAYGYLEIVQCLFERGVDIHAMDDCALRWASSNGHLEVVKYLVEHGSDIHIAGDCALRWARANGYLDVVKYLVEHGAGV